MRSTLELCHNVHRSLEHYQCVETWGRHVNLALISRQEGPECPMVSHIVRHHEHYNARIFAIPPGSNTHRLFLLLRPCMIHT